MIKSKIEWTSRTWNPTTGCTKISAGCKNCYAERAAERMRNSYLSGDPKFKAYINGFKFTQHHNRLQQPYYWKPQMVFVNSMSDLFHEEAELDFIKVVFKIMNDCQRMIFQVLTKRPERLLELSSNLNFTSNIWVGTSVADNKSLRYIDALRQVPAHVRFVSFEPLIESIPEVNLEGIHWGIIGGESPGLKGDMRPCKISWITELVNLCDAQGVAVFVKQLGGDLGRMMGMKNDRGYPDLKGGEFAKFPEHLQRREYPINVGEYFAQWEPEDQILSGTPRKWNKRL